MTQEESRDAFLRHAATMVRYWLNEESAVTPLEKMNGLVFALLVALDGSAAALPPFDVTPVENDAGFPRENIAGSLHEVWHRYEPKQ